MKRLQAFKFQLLPKYQQEQNLCRFAGCCRFLWNRALAIEKESYEKEGKRLGYNILAGKLIDWKKEDSTSFLAEVHSQILQQTLKDLDRAYKNFFEKRSEFPRFKKKGVHDSFRYPQGFKLDEENSRIFLPKIGWFRYRKSRMITGKPKQATISRRIGKWYVSIQTEEEAETPIHPSDSTVGIDMGIVNFATMSDGTIIKPLNSFRKYERKLAYLQRKFSKKVKFSSNWQKIKVRIQRLHKKIADVRHDFLHKASTIISKNHAFVVLEDLKVENMSQSTSGTLEKPGKHVKIKSQLNKSILDQGWYEFRRQLEYKTNWNGGKLILVSPKFTSQKCSKCGSICNENRPYQSLFHCINCGYETNADFNASLNILAAGRAVSACGAENIVSSAMKQEPAYDAAL